MGNSKEKQNKSHLMNNTFIKRAGLVVALIQTASALALHKAGCLGMHQSTTSNDANGSHFGGPGMAGDPCLGFNENAGMAFPDCVKGLKCMDTHEVSIVGASKTCAVPAQVNEPCEGHDENTDKPFPDCADDLICMQTSEVSIVGAGKTCVIPA